MKRYFFLALCSVASLAGTSSLAPTIHGSASPLSNSKMTTIYDADQADRADSWHIDWSKVSKLDAARRTAVNDILVKGELHSGADFRHAAFVFQHGDKTDDFLMAHTLAMIAVNKGDKDAIWIASATLDRYLIRIGQPQIYGTQTSVTNGGPPTLEPFNRLLISDAIRTELGVPSIADLEKRRADYEAQMKKSSAQ